MLLLFIKYRRYLMNFAIFNKYRHCLKNIAAIYYKSVPFGCYRIFRSVLAAVHFTLAK